jgi:acetylornithine deacetylase/succinyl-diaminopimelate desuccinylase-like protein
MNLADAKQAIERAIRPERLLDLAVKLVEVPSPTRDGRAVADRLATILADDGFPVERPAAGWPQAPAVVARFDTGRPGRTLQFNGHLDTVHLPFVPPRVKDGVLYGSGASDMKGGIAAMCEAMRALRDAGILPAGQMLVTAHDLHESPWGDGSQVDGLIDAGYLGDGVLLPEYLCDRLPVVGRGLAILEAKITRDGPPVHEVLGGIDQPSVIHAGARLVGRLAELDRTLKRQTHPLAGRASCFVGQVHSGEIFNQAPVEFRLSGTRRWLPGTPIAELRREYQSLLAEVAQETRTRAEGEFILTRDAFELDEGHALVSAFQAAHGAISGAALPRGAKPFVDDGNTFAARGRVPAITHGPDAKGAHTLNEAVPVAELVRVAHVYALTAMGFCGDRRS